jgi:hypothetical protein
MLLCSILGPELTGVDHVSRLQCNKDCAHRVETQ